MYAGGTLPRDRFDDVICDFSSSVSSALLFRFFVLPATSVRFRDR
jgi:hypothetical protein